MSAQWQGCARLTTFRNCWMRDAAAKKSAAPHARATPEASVRSEQPTGTGPEAQNPDEPIQRHVSAASALAIPHARGRQVSVARVASRLS